MKRKSNIESEKEIAEFWPVYLMSVAIVDIQYLSKVLTTCSTCMESTSFRTLPGNSSHYQINRLKLWLTSLNKDRLSSTLINHLFYFCILRSPFFKSFSSLLRFWVLLSFLAFGLFPSTNFCAFLVSLPTWIFGIISLYGNDHSVLIFPFLPHQLFRFFFVFFVNSFLIVLPAFAL